jgi:hypothetical protein
VRDVGATRSYSCRRCGTGFVASSGGGWFFDLLHCDRCGASRHVEHESLGEIHLRFVKGLATPYALARAAFDRQVQAEYPAEPLSRDEYHAAAEATLEPCDCGGAYSYKAPGRCPTCRSTPDDWDLASTGGMVIYD